MAVRDETLFRRLKDVSRLLGLGVGADGAFLCARGLKTLPLRLRHSERNALEIVDWLLTQPSVLRILHPARPGHPGHSIWKRDFSGSAGVFSIVLRPGDEAALDRAFRALRLFKIGASWGGVHSLVAPSNPRKGRADLAWLPEGQLVRLSIGLEDVEDLIADLQRFFAEIAPATNRAAAGATGKAG